MKKARNIILALLCALLLIVGSVAGTLAYLTSLSGEVKNTFTAGSVQITLDESKVTEYGEVVVGADPVTANQYKLIPGQSYTKNPTIHVKAGSERCYLFVKIVNGISAIEAAGNTTIAAQLEANGWKALAGQDGVYYYCKDSNEVVDARAGAVDVPVFGSFKLDGNADVASYATAEITITAYAVQADNLADAAAAWTAASTDWQQPTP